MLSSPSRLPSRLAADRERQQLIAHRRARSLALGPCMWLQFEDERTVQQARQEGWESAVCAHLLPDGRQWKATLLIRPDGTRSTARELPHLHDAARQLYVQLPKLPRVYGQVDDELPLRPPLVTHVLRFDFPPPLRVALLAGAPASLGCAHDQYAYRRVIPLATLEQLRCDLAGPPRRGPSHV
jgi:2-polyprenyl-6-methoxyphenol hydroxylase-like FAD-dependent oxidoreductase